MTSNVLKAKMLDDDTIARIRKCVSYASSAPKRPWMKRSKGRRYVSYSITINNKFIDSRLTLSAANRTFKALK